MAYVDEYANFASTIPGGANFDVNERDSLTYVAAERVYMRGEVAEARDVYKRQPHFNLECLLSKKI